MPVPYEPEGSLRMGAKIQGTADDRWWTCEFWVATECDMYRGQEEDRPSCP